MCGFFLRDVLVQTGRVSRTRELGTLDEKRKLRNAKRSKCFCAEDIPQKGKTSRLENLQNLKNEFSSVFFAFFHSSFLLSTPFLFCVFVCVFVSVLRQGKSEDVFRPDLIFLGGFFVYFLRIHAPGVSQCVFFFLYLF